MIIRFKKYRINIYQKTESAKRKAIFSAESVSENQILNRLNIAKEMFKSPEFEIYYSKIYEETERNLIKN